MLHRTSYDRYWEGRKSFAQMTSNIRNLSRQIWINVAPPPTDDEPLHAKGKTPVTNVTAQQLRRRKADALRLCLSFAFATKHYLRGEDGLKWEDYNGVLPPAFVRSDESGSNPQRTLPGSYSTTRNASIAASIDTSGRSSPDNTMASPKSDATKRVRPKRSKTRISAETPLLSSAHRTVDFHPLLHETSLPLPLAYAYRNPS